MKSIVIIFLFLSITPAFGQKNKQDRTESKVNQLKKMIVGKYSYDEGCCHCLFQLSFRNEKNKLIFNLKTKKRDISGIAKVLTEDQHINILLPIEWDDYQGDMTQKSYKPYKGKKPFGVHLNFNPKLKTLSFQNYGNAMNNYTIFNECYDDKGINLINDKYPR